MSRRVFSAREDTLWHLKILKFIVNLHLILLSFVEDNKTCLSTVPTIISVPVNTQSVSHWRVMESHPVVVYTTKVDAVEKEEITLL